jgi:hypothetical protein
MSSRFASVASLKENKCKYFSEFSLSTTFFLLKIKFGFSQTICSKEKLITI